MLINPAEALLQHKIVTKKLDAVMLGAFAFIKQNLSRISERDVQKFILDEFQKQGLKIDRDRPIVAVGKNSATVHYFAAKKFKVIDKDDLIIIDIWAGSSNKNSHFADITWAAYTGPHVPLQISKIFKIIVAARNAALAYIKGELRKKNFPYGYDVDQVVRNYFKKVGMERFFLHGTGHSLGCRSCHGKFFNLSRLEHKRLRPNIPFTIEPGLYFKNKFGIRSELDCYLTPDYQLKITSSIQRQIVKIY